METQKFDPKFTTFAAAAQSRSGRFAVRTVENLTGRLQMLFRVSRFRIGDPQTMWSDVLTHMGGRLEIGGNGLAGIPKDGPVLVYSNHPYGLLDGIVQGALLEQSRGTFRMVAFDALAAIPGFGQSVLPVSYGHDAEARTRNANTRQAMEDWLAAGGAVGTFPAANVSAAPTPWGRALDPEWPEKTARIAIETGATVVPLYFHGTNSRAFQIASHLGNAYRSSLFFYELKRSLRRPIRLSLGEPVTASDFADAATLNRLMRHNLYVQSGHPEDLSQTGFGPKILAQSADLSTNKPTHKLKSHP